MSKDNFYKNSFIVIAANLITGTVSFVFSIVLSRVLGTEGLGLYGLISPIYFLLLGIVSDGLVTALSKITAVYHSKSDYMNLSRTIRTTYQFIFIWSLFITLIVFFGSGKISTVIINDPRSSSALKVICPALFFVPFSAVLKGYFYGVSKFHITAIIDIFEKLLRVVALTGIITVLSLSDVKSTVTAAYAAIAAGEAVSFTILLICYRRHKRNLYTKAAKKQSRIQLIFNVLAVSLPLCANGFLSSILSSITTLILPRRLISTGMSYNSALSLIGSFSGMAMGITLFPLIIVNSISTVLIPDLSLSMSQKDYWSAENRIHQVLKIALLTGISTLLISQSIPDELGLMLFKRNDIGKYIRYASVCSIFCFVSSPTYGILNGLGKQRVLLRNSLIVSVEELIAIFILTGIPSINIYGLGISLIITSLTSLALNCHEIKKFVEIKVPFAELLLYASVGMLAFMTLNFIKNIFPNSFLVFEAVVIAATSFGIVFGLTQKLEKLLAD